MSLYLLCLFVLNNKTKFLENLKQGFKKTISCDNYRSEITMQPKTTLLGFLYHQKYFKLIGIDLLRQI